MQVYLVGRWSETEGDLFGVQGIFSQGWRADDACKDERCFVLPFELDKEAETLDVMRVKPRIPATEDPFATGVQS